MQSEAEKSPADKPVREAGTVARWVHAHKGDTQQNPLGYTVYQYLRSAAASVPYGVSMAVTWLAFDKTSRWAGDVEKAATTAGKSAPLAKYLKMYTASPLMRTSAMIGTSFSLYRATSKIGKWVNEYLFDPTDSLELTQKKMETFPDALKSKIEEVYLPEFHATLISSMVLGGLVTAANHATTSMTNLGADGKPVGEHFTKAISETKAMLGGNHSFSSKGWSHFWKEAIANPKANFIPQAAIYSLGYALFFELGDRRFIAKQDTRGLWKERFSSIGSGSRANPSLLESPVLEPQAVVEAEPREENGDEPSRPMLGDLPKGSRMADTLSVLTSEPSALRFVTRRFLPTAVGITGYTALKFRAAPLFLGKFTEGLAHWKDVPLHAWREGTATSLFFMVPLVSDKWAPLHDRLADNLEALVSGRTYEQVIRGYQPPRQAPEKEIQEMAPPSPKEDRTVPDPTISRPVAVVETLQPDDIRRTV